MAVYRYTAVSAAKNGRVQRGTVLAKDKLDAFDKLKHRQLTNINLHRLEGFAAVFAHLRADIR